MCVSIKRYTLSAVVGVPVYQYKTPAGEEEAKKAKRDIDREEAEEREETAETRKFIVFLINMKPLVPLFIP